MKERFPHQEVWLDAVLESAAKRLANRLQRRPNGCLEWVGPVDGGYGRIGVGSSKVERTHRLAWILVHGPIPKDKVVCHRCDNRRCCDVSHLFLGSVADNTKDMVNKRRQAWGTRVATNKLSEQQVLAIRRAISQGCTNRTLAKQYGVGSSTIQAIRKRKSWARL